MLEETLANLHKVTHHETKEEGILHIMPHNGIVLNVIYDKKGNLIDFVVKE